MQYSAPAIFQKKKEKEISLLGSSKEAYVGICGNMFRK